MEIIGINSLKELKEKTGNQIANLGQCTIDIDGRVVVTLLFTNSTVRYAYSMRQLGVGMGKDEIKIREDFNELNLYDKTIATIELMEDMGFRVSFEKMREHFAKIHNELKDNVKKWN